MSGDKVAHDLAMKYMDLYSKPFERNPETSEDEVVHRYMSEYLRVLSMIQGWMENNTLEKTFTVRLQK